MPELSKPHVYQAFAESLGVPVRQLTREEKRQALREHMIGLEIKQKTDTICGIDRYEHSKEYGKAIVDHVILWKSAGCKGDGKNVKGLVKDGDPVTVHKSKLKKLFLYYLVSCDQYPKHQEGWLRAEMLKERGKHRPGIKA